MACTTAGPAPAVVVSKDINVNEQQYLAAVRDAIRRNDRDRAVAMAARMVQTCPQFQAGQVLFSQIMLEMGRQKLALDAARKAIVIDKTNVRAMLALSRAYQAAGFLRQAIQAAHRAETLLGDDIDDVSSLGTAYFHQGEYDDSIRMHLRAVASAPDNVLYRYNLAISLQAEGRLEDAETEFLRVVRADPNHVESWMNLSRVRKQTPDDNHVDELERLLAETGSWENTMRLNFSLAKEFEDLREYDRAFDALVAGSVARRENMPYEVARDVRFVDALIDCFPSGCFDTGAGGFDSREPIFIVGMPRSGTTLTEQILAGHSEVFAAGELRDMPLNLSLQLGTKVAVDEMASDQLRRVLATNPAALGHRYIQKTRPRTGHTRHFIDKLPRNSHLCGFIHWALPNARIIVLERHPLDVCLSNFKVLFNRGYEYSYDLDDLATYYIAYRRLMDHWSRIIPADRYYRVSYEALVADQETETRKLLDFCGLEWQDACLEFYRNRESVTTASLAQVRQPIYRSAVQRWRHYEKQLEPLRHRLEDAGIDCG